MFNVHTAIEMKGVNAGFLNIYVVKRNETLLVWRFGGADALGDIWNVAKTSLPIYDGEFSVIFEGIVS